MLKNQKNQLRRPPRLGKIKVGEKSDKGYPTSVDYFIIDSDYKDQVAKVYGDKPKSLKIVFPYDDIEQNLDEMYRMYGKSGLKCIGDGESAKRADVDGKLNEEITCTCHFATPPDDQKQQCFPSMNLSFIITGIGVTGLWMFSSKAVYSRSNIRAVMEMVQATTGKLAGVPFFLRVDMQESNVANNPHKFPVVNIDCAMDLEALMKQNLQIDAPQEKKSLTEHKNISGDGVEADTIDEDLHTVDNPKDTIQNEVNDNEKQDNPLKLTKLALKEWLLFDKYLEENKDKISVDIYTATREWLDTRNSKVANMKIISNFDKFKKTVESASEATPTEYESYHESLIKSCMGTAKSDRDTVIALLDQLVFRWHIFGLEKLIETTENQCLNLLEEFDEIHKQPKESIEEILEKDYPAPNTNREIPDQDEDDLPF